MGAWAVPVIEKIKSTVKKVPPIAWVIIAGVVLAIIVMSRKKGGASTPTVSGGGGGGTGTSLSPDAGATLAGLQAQVAVLSGQVAAVGAPAAQPPGSLQRTSGPTTPVLLAGHQSLPAQVVAPTALSALEVQSSFDAPFIQGVLDKLDLAPQHYPVDAGIPSTGVPIWEGLKVGTIDPGGRLVLGAEDIVNPPVVYNAAQEPIGYNPGAQYTLSQARAWWDNWLANPYDISKEHNIPVSLSLTAEQKAKVRSFNMVGVPATAADPGTSWSP